MDLTQNPDFSGKGQEGIQLAARAVGDRKEMNVVLPRGSPVSLGDVRGNRICCSPHLGHEIVGLGPWIIASDSINFGCQPASLLVYEEVLVTSDFRPQPLTCFWYLFEFKHINTFVIATISIRPPSFSAIMICANLKRATIPAPDSRSFPYVPPIDHPKTSLANISPNVPYVPSNQYHTTSLTSP